MKNKPLFIGLGVFALLASGFCAKQVHAAEDNCVLGASDFTAIQAIQNDPTLSYSQEITQELALRKQLLSETITCAASNDQAIQNTIDTASSTSAQAIALQAQFLQKTNDAINFYNLETAKLNGSGIKGTETIAKEITSWREANYIPLESNIDNFMLWSNNQTLFQTAQTRLTQTQQVVAFIENITTNNNLSNSLQAVQSSLATAQSDNNTAATALSQLQPADQTLATIQQSLQALADTYQKFTDLNTLIQKLLPTTSQ